MSPILWDTDLEHTVLVENCNYAGLKQTSGTKKQLTWKVCKSVFIFKLSCI